jgi:Mg-chelatase subunit ChlD
MDADDWNPSRLAGAKTASKSYVLRLSSTAPQARVAVIAYSSRAKVLCPLTPVSKLVSIEAAIDRICTSNATNITAGLAAALKTLGPGERRCQIVLLSDGWHNCGASPLATAAKLKRRAVIECVGIGGRPNDVDEVLMREIASARPDGFKRYRWIGDPVGLVDHFQQLAGGITRS